MIKFLFHLLISVIAFAIAFKIADRYIIGFDFRGNNEGLLLAAFIFALLQTFINPILRFFLSPLIILTLGLFMFVIHAFLLYILTNITNDITISDNYALFLTAVLTLIINVILQFLARRIL